MTEASKEELEKFREYSKRIDRMLKEHEKARARGNSHIAWAILIVAALATAIFAAGMLFGAILMGLFR